MTSLQSVSVQAYGTFHCITVPTSHINAKQKQSSQAAIKSRPCKRHASLRICLVCIGHLWLRGSEAGYPLNSNWAGTPPLCESLAQRKMEESTAPGHVPAPCERDDTYTQAWDMRQERWIMHERQFIDQDCPEIRLNWSRTLPHGMHMQYRAQVMMGECMPVNSAAEQAVAPPFQHVTCEGGS